MRMSSFMECRDDGSPKNKDQKKANDAHSLIRTSESARCDLLKLSSYCLNKVKCMGETHMAACKKDKSKMDNCDTDCGGAQRTSVLASCVSALLVIVALLKDDYYR